MRAQSTRAIKTNKINLWRMAMSDNNEQTQKAVPSIKITNLTKQYPRAAAPSVSDLSLVCYPKEIVGLLGHNGAGKSTTLKCLTGMLPFNSGSIEINGFDIKTSPVKAKYTFGYVSDKHDVFVKMTGIQYVNFMADAYGVGKDERKERLAQLDEIFTLGERLKEPISNYSHGMRQKVCMLASLIHKPKLWILDEPMIGLDPATSEKVSTFMKEYAAKGNCILFSSHNINSVRRICDRAVIINKGVKIDDINFADFALSGDELEEYFLARTVAASAVANCGDIVNCNSQSSNNENFNQELVTTETAASRGDIAGCNSQSSNNENPDKEAVTAEIAAAAASRGDIVGCNSQSSDNENPDKEAVTAEVDE